MGENYLVIDRNWSVACGNRCVTLYFCLDELLSPEQKHQETHLCSCAKSLLGELGSLERDNDLVWANQPSLSESLPRFFSFATVSASPRRD